MAVNSVDRSVWSPSRNALWSQRWGDYDDDQQNYPTAILLRHPTAPYVDVVPEINDEHMQCVSYKYLIAANSLDESHIDRPLKIPCVLLTALAPAASPRDSAMPMDPPDPRSFKWLPIGWPPQTHNSDPQTLVSFQAMRQDMSDGTTLRDRTVVMLATRLSDFLQIKNGAGIIEVPYGFEFGIRIVAHVWRRPDTGYEVRITGMSASLPFGAWQNIANDEGITTERLRLKLRLLLDPGARGFIAEAAGLGAGSIQLPAIRVGVDRGGVHRVEQLVFGAASRALGSTPYSLLFGGTVEKLDALINKVALVADAKPGDAWVFPRNPASQPEDGTDKIGALHKRRPTRAEKAFRPYRCEAEITEDEDDPLVYPPRREIPDPAGAGPADARGPDTLDVDELRVEACPGFVRADRERRAKDHDGTKKVRLPGTADHPHPRSNDYSAVSAEYNFAQFFERLFAYGIDSHQYFLHAKLPLKVYYRSGIRPGPGKDGRTVNARVMVEGQSEDYEGGSIYVIRPFLQVHLALASLSTRFRKPWHVKTGPEEAQPMGIATDARWIWHELGHVLLMASTGELQFRFAHSAGDALAAIVGDPQSILATDRKWRGSTFPWVYLPRRHDRCVCEGWSWTGLLHRDLAQVEHIQGPRRKGYWSEQILSSSLFRLYRCIGGDTTNGDETDEASDIDKTARESASHYCVYLIIRGIQLLGTTYVVPAYEPDQFVCALIDADIGTGRWDVTFKIPPDPPKPEPKPDYYLFRRVGGCVHKVIRWAFEAQGLYGSASAPSDARGTPPPVDIFIRDLRPLFDAATLHPLDYGPGSYVPVSLDWSSDQYGSGPAPAWQADPEHGIVSSDDGVHVKVGNRGSRTAQNVTVSVWWCLWPDTDNSPPEWNDSNWQPCAPQAIAGQNIEPTKDACFGPFAVSGPSPGSRYVVLAQATCDDDMANTVPEAKLPCGREKTALVDLVPNDNNLGLRVFGGVPPV
jgi:hypothetical protein